jgi:hypothetical protein
MDALGHDKIADRLLKYRFGISNSILYHYRFDGREVESNELFDISFKQVRRALEVNRYSVSLFKPLVAKRLYEQYAGAGATVWDPCAGFGGRMLGFFAANGSRYIACDPNSRAMGELSLLTDGIGKADKASLYVLPMEDMVLDSRTLDLVMTSPPYFDKEHYCESLDQSDVVYKSRQAWINGFLATLGRKAAAALKPGGKYVLVIDVDLLAPTIDTASGAGLVLLEHLPLRNTATHLTGKDSSEHIAIFQKPETI